MTLDSAVESHNDSSRMTRDLSRWYALNLDIRRLWAYEAGAVDAANPRDIHVVVELAPVCDSDDTSPIWLARCAGWQRQLQGLIGRRVYLECFNQDVDMAPCADGPPEAPVCLAGLAWRDCSADLTDIRSAA